MAQAAVVESPQVEVLEDDPQALPGAVPIQEVIPAQLMRTLHDMAVKRPRSFPEVRALALEELEAAPEFAKKAYYAIPYRERKGDDSGQVTMVEGPSIKAAMALARHWGNCVDMARVVSEDDQRVIVQGIFVDVQTLRIVMRQVAVGKRAWSKTRQRFEPLRPDRLGIAIQAGMSKAVRNAALAEMPVALVDEYFGHAKAIASGEVLNISIARRMKDLVTAFAEHGVGKAQIQALLGKSAANRKDVAKLQGVLNALDDGQTKVEDVFGLGKEAVAPAPGMSAEQIIAGQNGGTGSGPTPLTPLDEARVLLTNAKTIESVRKTWVGIETGELWKTLGGAEQAALQQVRDAKLAQLADGGGK